ncbi:MULTISPECIES: aldo/keto reductase [unclassified Microbacterium]|uniref:aldo/keto reductase n=1 Tax=unclassified Microbacterium TaxID=2609290 RepID=UPI00346690D3
MDAGKVRFLGLSNTIQENVRKAHAVHPISVVQAPYSLFDRSAETFFPVLEKLEVGLVAYRPLARGFLTGAVKTLDGYSAGDFRRRNPWWAPANFGTNVAIAEELSELAQSKGATLSQLSLAWLLARKPFIVPIPGSRNADRVTEITIATDLLLTPEDHIEQIIRNSAAI